MRLRDVKIATPDPRKYIQATCAVCNRFVKGKGYFCSFDCDEAERYSRLADKLVDGLRAAHGF